MVNDITTHVFARECGRNVRKQFDKFIEKKSAVCSTYQRGYMIPESARSTFCIAFSPDGRCLASSHGDHTVRVCDSETLRVTHVLTGHRRTPWCLRFHPRVNQVLASGCLFGEVYLWNLDLKMPGSLIWSSSCSITALEFHPHDEVLLIGTGNQIVYYDWHNKKQLATIYTKHDNEVVRYLKFTPLGDKLITGIRNLYPMEDMSVTSEYSCSCAQCTSERSSASERKSFESSTDGTSPQGHSTGEDQLESQQAGPSRQAGTSYSQQNSQYETGKRNRLQAENDANSDSKRKKTTLLTEKPQGQQESSMETPEGNFHAGISSNTFLSGQTNISSTSRSEQVSRGMHRTNSIAQSLLSLVNENEEDRATLDSQSHSNVANTSSHDTSSSRLSSAEYSEVMRRIHVVESNNTAMRRLISRAFAVQGSLGVSDNVNNKTNRLQLWNCNESTQFPAIHQYSCNMIVDTCKIHNDNSVSMSRDGHMIAVFVPCEASSPMDIELRVFSLAPSIFQHCIYTRKFGPNAITVSISPLSGYVLVGLASRKFEWTLGIPNKQLIGQVMKIPDPLLPILDDQSRVASNLFHQKGLLHQNEQYISVNTLRFHPTPGMGILFGSNKGDVQHFQIGSPQKEERRNDRVSSHTHNFFNF